MKRFLLPLIVLSSLHAAATAQPERTLATPTPQQILYQDMEITMFVALDPCTWQGREYDDHSTPLSRINPAKLDVNQWIDAAELIGAKMILFVAKHTGGFCWWQTETSDYSIKNTPYKNGRGDVLKELSDACWKRGMKLGIYIYPGDDTWGAYMGGSGRTKDPSKQEAYNRVLRKQWEEALSRYGTITEIWFDGSCIVPLDDIIQKYAPEAVIFQGPMASIRWVGNENGFAPYPAWNSVKKEDGIAGVATAANGDPNGDMWMPLEVDIPLKNHDWFWSSTNEKNLKSLDELIETYYKSVGRGATLLVNSAPDTTGLIPRADMTLYRTFGAEIHRRFRASIAHTSGKGDTVELDLGKPTRIDHVITMEDITFGERVRQYVLEGYWKGEWRELARGISIGHKRIDRFPPVRIGKVRFRCLTSAAPPVIRSLAAYMVGDTKQYNSVKSVADDYGNAWTAGETTHYTAPVLIGELSKHFTPADSSYTFDLSQFIDEAGQYQLFVSASAGDPPVRPERGSIWLQGVETPGFCKVNSAFGRLEINITAAPTKKEGSIIIKFTLKDTVKGVKLYMRKVVFG